MWSDVEASIDYLNFGEVAELMAGLLADPTLRPISIGLFGGWGSGKSTLLELVKQRVEKPGGEGPIVVNFDAWLYQGFDDARTALLDEITSALKSAAEKKKGVLERIGSLYERIDKLRALALVAEGALTVATGVPTFGRAAEVVERMLGGRATEEDVEAAKAVAKKAAKSARSLAKVGVGNESPSQQIAAIRRELSTLLREIDRPLLVFIDNLDRCVPKSAIKTLEAVRLFLFMPETGFVIAADDDMIRHAIREHYEFSSNAEKHVTDYLDKLVQMRVAVPRLGEQEVRAYLFMLVASISQCDKKSVEALRAELDASLSIAWSNSSLPIERVLEILRVDQGSDLALSLIAAEQASNLLATASAVAGNPRTIKRLMNSVRMRARLAKRRKLNVTDMLLLKLAILERCVGGDATAEFGRLVSKAGGKPKEIGSWESAAKARSMDASVLPEFLKNHASFLSEWLTLEPTLADVDLRPAMHLSRDLFAATASRLTLSKVALDALNALLELPTASSQVGLDLVRRVPATEHVPLMEELVARLAKVSDWTGMPRALNGARLLASNAPSTRPLLSRFLTSIVGKQRHPWLVAQVKQLNESKDGGE